jgi:uncharacterized lipoprotein YddW (UPF0748 family)
LEKHRDVVSSIIFDDRYGIFKDAMSEIAARYDIPDGYRGGQTGWIRDRLTENLKDIKNTVASLGPQFSISSHKISWARDKNNQDLERWLKEGIIDGEYNFQLYKNGTQYESFIQDYKANMESVATALSNNKTGIPSLSVSLGYQASEEKLSQLDIRRQINYLKNRDPNYPNNFVLNNQNILGFDYGNLVINVPPI